MEVGVGTGATGTCKAENVAGAIAGVFVTLVGVGVFELLVVSGAPVDDEEVGKTQIKFDFTKITDVINTNQKVKRERYWKTNMSVSVCVCIYMCMLKEAIQTVPDMDL